MTEISDKQRVNEYDEIVSAERGSVVEPYGAKTSLHSEVIVAETRLVTLPVAASCTVVCGIASELIKHCLGLEQFEGGRLVAECVSFYLIKRAAMRKNRVQATLAFERKQSSVASDILLHREVYDEVSVNGVIQLFGFFSILTFREDQ